MSISFLKCKNPPLNKDWQVWTKNSSVTSEEIIAIKTFVEVTEGLVTEDIINTIVYFMFENRYVSFEKDYVNDLWQKDLFKWFEYWCGNPIEHILNPLYVTKNNFEMTNPMYIKKLGYEQLGIVIRKNVENVKNIKVKIAVASSSACLGISFPNYDVKNIKKCTMKTEDLVFRSSYVLNDENCITPTFKEGCGIEPCKFYYDPKFKVIPVTLLCFTQFSFSLELFDETIKPKVVATLNVFSIADFFLSKNEYHLNEEDHHHHLIIENGTISYKW